MITVHCSIVCVQMPLLLASDIPPIRFQNFLANVIEAQFVGNSADSHEGETLLGQAMDASNLFFTAVFTVELSINMVAHWLQPFLRNPWSLLDAFVVLMSLVALGPVDIPITILRLMRAFRVIRLFGRLKALKKMVSALSASIVPMMNAFLILFILASICESGADPFPLRARGSRLTPPHAAQTPSSGCRSSGRRRRSTSGGSSRPSSPCSGLRPTASGRRPSRSTMGREGSTGSALPS
jgi:hypothetical protein